uniref:Uncharacterized protein n=1 Tax=Salix viminalis TaxID=40686 RepID=A0A6N2MNC9_SALVM
MSWVFWQEVQDELSKLNKSFSLNSCFGYFGKNFLSWVFWQEVQDEPSKLRHFVSGFAFVFPFFTVLREAYKIKKFLPLDLRCSGMITFLLQFHPTSEKSRGLELQQYRGTDSRLSFQFELAPFL